MSWQVRALTPSQAGILKTQPKSRLHFILPALNAAGPRHPEKEEPEEARSNKRGRRGEVRKNVIKGQGRRRRNRRRKI